jgi:GNAT superfamily N-acetyltransferase
MNLEIISFKDTLGNLASIRPITPNDKDHLRQGFKQLSKESVKNRFQFGKNDFSENELIHLTEVDQKNHLSYVVFYLDNDEEIPAGVIRGVKIADRPGYLEMAITIIDRFQKRGLGIHLLEALANKSISEGHSHFFGELHNSNLKMIKLLEKFSINRHAPKIDHLGEGYLSFEIPLKSL